VLARIKGFTNHDPKNPQGIGYKAHLVHTVSQALEVGIVAERIQEETRPAHHHTTAAAAATDSFGAGPCRQLAVAAMPKASPDTAVTGSD
jgi:hypothetical protein